MKDRKKICGNCSHSVIHLPIDTDDKYSQFMICMKWCAVTKSDEICGEFIDQNDVNYFHTWNERTQRPNTIYSELEMGYTWVGLFRSHHEIRHYIKENHYNQEVKYQITNESNGINLYINL